ncbi:hypothetical protein KCP69_23250 [Salmonella enterica subsp. enterica]|nr:hypothetical protein KCP69_23250 [Salmonella enterica subsp. enterica]
MRLGDADEIVFILRRAWRVAFLMEAKRSAGSASTITNDAAAATRRTALAA